MKILTFGDCAVDYYIKQKKYFTGGCCYNFSVHMATYGLQCTIVSAIGSDLFGKEIKKNLEKISVNINHLQLFTGDTAMQKISLCENERIFCGYSMGVLQKVSIPHNIIQSINRYDAIYVTIQKSLEHLFQFVSELKTSALKIVDISKEYDAFSLAKNNSYIIKALTHFDILFYGGCERNINYFLEISKLFPHKIIVLTMGKSGSIAFHNNTQNFQNIINNTYSIKDSNGCGDAFQGCFVAKYLYNYNIPHALIAASHYAAKTLSHLGATRESIILYNS